MSRPIRPLPASVANSKSVIPEMAKPSRSYAPPRWQPWPVRESRAGSNASHSTTCVSSRIKRDCPTPREISAGETTSPEDTALARKEPEDSVSLRLKRDQLCHRFAALCDNDCLVLGLHLVHNRETIRFEVSRRYFFHIGLQRNHGHYTMVTIGPARHLAEPSPAASSFCITADPAALVPAGPAARCFARTRGRCLGELLGEGFRRSQLPGGSKSPPQGSFFRRFQYDACASLSSPCSIHGGKGRRLLASTSISCSTGVTFTIARVLFG